MPTPAPAYVVQRTLADRPYRDFLFSHPMHGAIVPGADLGSNPNIHRPEHFTLESAEEFAKKLNEAGASPAWEVHLAANSCPSCGRAMWANDHDFCHPENRERTKWRAGCNVHDFGCGFEVSAEVSTEAEMLKVWNAATVFTYPNESYARVEHLGTFGLEAALKDVFHAYPEYRDTEQYPDGFRSMVAKFASDPFFNLHFVARHYRFLTSTGRERVEWVAGCNNHDADCDTLPLD